MQTEQLLPAAPAGPVTRPDDKAGKAASYKTSDPSWKGDFFFALSSLIFKDFKIRYRSMSLGVFWSLLNPLVMMGVLTVVFGWLQRNAEVTPVYLMCGLVPYNFFSVAWISGTLSLLDNAGLIKRVRVPREIVPFAAVLSNCLHLMIQICLLFALVFYYYGFSVNRYWLWLPYVWAMEVIFVTGLALLTSALNVYVRDMRYLVESATTVLFWLVPIVYTPQSPPAFYHLIDGINPLSALIRAMRNILMHGQDPGSPLLFKLTGASLVMFAIGFLVFQRLKPRFYDHL